MTTDNFCFYLQNRLIKQEVNGTMIPSPFNIPRFTPPAPEERLRKVGTRARAFLGRRGRRSRRRPATSSGGRRRTAATV
jgi:hypothetical protein